MDPAYAARTSGATERSVCVAVDAMGGDHGPAEVVPGALGWAREHPEDTVLLVGEEDRIAPHIEGPLPGRVTIVPATELVTMDESPAAAVRRKRDASISVAMRLVRSGRADAVVSAGHTGAGVAAAILGLGRLRSVDRPALAIQVVSDKHDAAYEEQIQKRMEAGYKEAGIRFGGGITSGMIRQQNELFFNILVALLLVMAVLMAAVGGLGLMGTMTLNVLERTREIGVMRAIGASNGSVRQIVLVEGVLIGALSWLIGALLAIPFGQLLSQALGEMIFAMPLHYVISIDGMLIWLIVVMVIAVFASLLPAHNASRLTVRQVLAYE